VTVISIHHVTQVTFFKRRFTNFGTLYWYSAKI